MPAAPSGRKLFVSRGHFLAVCGLLSASAILVRLAAVPTVAVTAGFCAITMLLVTVAGFAAASGTWEIVERRANYSVTLFTVALIAGTTGYGTSIPALSGFIAVTLAAASLEFRQSAAARESADRPSRASANANVALSSTAAARPGGVESVDWDLESRLLAQLGADARPLRIHNADEEGPRDGAEREATFRLERGVLDDGSEWVEGVAQATFAHGRKQTSLHIPFWPPLSSIPEVAFEVLDAADVQIAPTGRYRWGIRLEVQRRGETPAAESVEIAFFLTAPRARSEAA